MSTRKKLVLGIVLLLVLVAALSGYVALQIMGDLRAARGTLAGATSDLTDEDLEATTRRLEAVAETLNGVAARPLGFIPVIGQNIHALDSIVSSSIPALEDAAQLRTKIDEAEQTGFVSDGKVEIQRVESLKAPLERQAKSLTDLRDSLEDHRSGWLLPPMWDAVTTLFNKSEDLQRTADRAALAVDLASQMLGDDEPRTFLVLLLNNAELRGAGGILSGVGTLTISDGRFELGEFEYYADLAAQAGKQTKVDAPPDLSRRFGRYWADTTLWVNTSASPDVPEVAVTARDLYEITTGIKTEGAIVIDALGLASLMPKDATIRVPGTEIELAQPELADFMYSDSYRVFDGATRERRETSLDLGPLIFESFLTQDLRREALEGLEDAIAGQHLRVVSFAAEERPVLATLGLSGELTTEAADSSLFTVQNLGADKLDYWIERDVEHGCRLSDNGAALCQMRVTLRNRTPKGLPRYVTQDKEPYGLYEGYLESYIPEKASITGYTIDGEEPQYFTESEDGRQSLGAYFDTPKNKSTRVDLTYDLSFPEDRYTLEMLPQPLAHAASARVVIVAPDGWIIETPDGTSGSIVEYKGALDRTLRFSAAPQERPGLTGIWDRLVDFWNNPIF